MLLEHCSGGTLRSLCARLPDYRLPEARIERRAAPVWRVALGLAEREANTQTNLFFACPPPSIFSSAHPLNGYCGW